MSGGANRGSLLLLNNNKSLYAIKDADTIHYYRGTYRLTDNGISCSFDSKYGHARGQTGKKVLRKKSQAGITPVRPWSITLQKTGCGEFIYYSDPSAADKSPDRPVRIVYREAEPGKAYEYIKRINNIEPLVDFHLELPAHIAAHRFVASETIEMIEKHFTGQNPSARVKRTESDSAVKLSFSYKKPPRGEPPGPFLYVNISKLRSRALIGDMNRDSLEDILVLPELSQGGGSKWKELFLFLKKGDGFVLGSQASAFDLAQYKGNSHSGSFHAREIRNGYIYGTSLCYRDEDAQCCPSVKIPTMVRLEKDRLKTSRVN